MTNSHNSGYFPGGTGLASATGDLVAVSPASALVNGTLTLPTVSGGTSTTTTSTAPSPLTGVYNIDSFSGAQNNVTGNMNVYDDAAASNMWSKILSDARSCTNVASGFSCMIVFGCHQYNWQSPVNFVVPSGMPTEVHITVNWNSSVHYTFGSAGICFSPYTMNGRYDDLFTRKTFYNRYQGVSSYAVKKTATAGVSSAAYSALNNTNETAGGGTSNFRFGQMDVFDANTGGHYLSWLDCSGLFFAQIDGPAGTSNPGGAVTSTHGCNYDGCSAIRLGGFNIQVWIKNLLPNYIECGLRIVGYVEALLTQNLGGVNCDWNVLCDQANTDWTGFYPGDSSYGLQWAFDDQSEMDAYRACFDLTTVNILFFYGGTMYQHAVYGVSSDNNITGDCSQNAGIILRGCCNGTITDCRFDGPGTNQGGSGDTYNTCVRVRGIQLLTNTYNGLSGKSNGPADGTYSYCTHLSIRDNDFAGIGNQGTLAPIYIANGCSSIFHLGNAWYYAPGYQRDGFCSASPVQDANGGNGGHDVYGTASPSSTNVTF